MSEAGIQVHVLGNRLSTGLAHSRQCKSFTRSTAEFDGTFSTEMVQEVNRQIAKLGIDLVFPGDALASRSFAAIRDQLDATAFPGPSLDVFDLLNNKWEFQRICEELGIPVPPTVLFDDAAALADAVQAGRAKFPAMAKPISLDGSRGVVKLTDNDYGKVLKQIDYAPILFQEFIPGEDIGASVFCREGVIESFIAHRLDRGVYSTFESENVLAAIQKISTKYSLNGVYNYDMRLSPTGEIVFLECNPRFFFKMCLSLVAGVNFVQPGITSPAAALFRPTDTSTKTPRAWPTGLLKPWALSHTDRAYIRFLLSDPVNFFREQLHIDWD